MKRPDFATLFDHLPNSYMVLDRELRFVAANRQYLEVTGKTLEQLIGRRVFEVFPNDPDEPNDAGRNQLTESWSRVLATRTTDEVAVIRYRVPRQTADGLLDTEERIWSATHVPILDEAGEVAYIVQHTVDVTELHSVKRAGAVEAGLLNRAEQVQQVNVSLEAERRYLRRLFEQAPGFVAVLRGPDHVFELANRAYFQLVGHREILGKSVRDALPEIAGQGYFELLDRVFASGEAFIGRSMKAVVQRVPGAPPAEVLMDLMYQPVVDPDGRVTGIFVQGHDITEQKRAQDEIRRYREHLEELVRERTRALDESEQDRRRAMEELFQAQKMEAVGKLTGGVAHDFNNLLQVIGGNLQLLSDDVESERGLRRLDVATRAVERGAKLATQLLAFARKQPLAPKVVHLESLLGRVDELLRRTIGEDIDLKVEISAGLWNAYADPHQLENVLLNLAINARDAMEGQGLLTLAARNVSVGLEDAVAALAPGDYLELSVSDTGCGMPPEIQARAFEPFFTTKGEGHGTGLGLSMVYGFAKQSGGHVDLTSEVGKGTTLRLLLPRTLAAPEDSRVEQPLLAGGRENILVVEDDAAVRSTVVELLQGFGYAVHTAPDAEAALALMEDGLRPDLLFTDVVMPGKVRSPDLAHRAQSLHPGLKVLFTSGYTADRFAPGGSLEPGVELLSKPYTREVLARRVRETLGGPGVQIPARTPPSGRPAVSRNEAAGPSPASVATDALQNAARVLLVEDDEDIRSLTSDLLVDLGFHVTAVHDAEAAFEALRDQEFRVLFTDVRLGRVSGLQLAREALRSHPTMRVLFSTGLGRAVLNELTGELQGAVLLPKPFEVWQLEEALRAVS